MSDRQLLRVFGAAAVLGGLLRIASAFVPWRPGSAPLELFYLVIDVLLLFGLMGIYFAHRSRLGALGLVGFVIAEAGIASIVGPDPTAFGIDTYSIGVVVIMLGLTMLSIQMLRRRVDPRWAPVCWLGAVLAGIGGGAIGQPELGFLIGGVSFGIGFFVAGVALWKDEQSA